ncbi:MAG: hypothetical protein AAF291_05545 [Pseudomonadota bacterium]
MNGAGFALLALVPLIAGTSPHDASDEAITVALCNGGAITIDLGMGEDTPERECHQKGCHAGTCREKQKAKGKSGN